MTADNAVELWETPVADEIFMIAGWRQWADAGSVSSVLPRYLITHLEAQQIGRIRPHGFYLFQLPGMHDLLRPQIKLRKGHSQELKSPDNQVYFWQSGRKGLVIMLGDEPHMNAEGYADAFFEVATTLNVRRIAVLGGVYAPVPYDRHRNISVTYSLRKMKDGLKKYAVDFSNYEGGASIGSYLAGRAEQLGLEYVALYAMVPYYDLSDLSPSLQGVGLEEDYRAWHDVMGRLSHMFDLGLDLSELRRRSDLMTESMARRLHNMERDAPDLHLQEYLAKITEDFVEKPFNPLGDVWETVLEDLFGDAGAE